MNQLWIAKSPEEAAALRTKAEQWAADNSGPKMIQVSLALDRLLETVAEVAKDMRDEGTRTIRQTSAALMAGSLLIAFLNLFVTRRATPPAVESGALLAESALASSPRPDQNGPQPFALPLENPDPLIRRE
jgi:hypothetical protein